MNQQQRNFLIKKIEESVKQRIKALDSSKPEAPNLNLFIFHAVMSDKFELKSIETIKHHIKERALQSKSKSGEDWLGNHWGNASDFKISFKIDDLFEIPEEYKKMRADYQEKRNKVDEEIRAILLQSEGLITRIQLASDKVLQKMINEVDDMGDISLMDTKLKLLN